MRTPGELFEHMNHIFRALEEANAEFKKLSIAESEAERAYRKALGITTFKLRQDGIPVTLISDMARGKHADLKFERDKNKALVKAQQSVLESLRSEIDASRSELKWLGIEFNAR